LQTTCAPSPLPLSPEYRGEGKIRPGHSSIDSFF
jgi:hypothetical protein